MVDKSFRFFPSAANDTQFKDNAAVVLSRTEVLQGNGNGRKITKSSAGSVLYTSDLETCVAIMLTDKKNGDCFMIHSDSNDHSGINAVRLEKGLYALGISPFREYTVGVIGGETDSALDNKISFLSKILPKITVTLKQSMENQAYLLHDGSMFAKKKDLAAHLGSVQIIMEPMPDRPPPIKILKSGS